jgi:hypothetical protein
VLGDPSLTNEMPEHPHTVRRERLIGVLLDSLREFSDEVFDVGRACCVDERVQVTIAGRAPAARGARERREGINAVVGNRSPSPLRTRTSNRRLYRFDPGPQHFKITCDAFEIVDQPRSASRAQNP